MILIDTSVWIKHLRRQDANLNGYLRAGRVLMHPYVVGELALGGFAGGDRLGFAELPRALVFQPAELCMFIASHRLAGTGLGYVDAHLLASTLLTEGALLWTEDQHLRRQSQKLGISFPNSAT